MSIHRDDVDQARAEALKTIRALIRLKHSIAADRELNELLPRAEAKFNAAVQRGQLLGPAEIKRAVGL